MVSGKIMSICGVLLFFLLLFVFLMEPPSNGSSIDGFGIVTFFIPAALLFILGRHRTNQAALLAKYKRYKQAMATGNIKNIEQLALAVSEPADAVLRDLNSLYRKGYSLNFSSLFPKEHSFLPSPAEAVASKTEGQLTTVSCPGCGFMNIISDKNYTCRYCRAPMNK